MPHADTETVVTAIPTDTGPFRVVSQRVQDEIYLHRLFGPGESQDSGKAGYTLGTSDAYTNDDLDDQHRGHVFTGSMLAHWFARLPLPKLNGES